MMTKAPKTAVLEAMRVLRYLQGTKHIGLCFKPCSNYSEVIAYTDANFSVKRSQTGAAKACGLRNNFRATGEFGPRICRACCSEPDELFSELPGPEIFSFGPLALARGKNVCVTNQKHVVLNNL